MKPLIRVAPRNRQHRPGMHSTSFREILIGLIYACASVACNDISTAPPPDPGPGPLTIVTSSPLPNGTINQPYATAVGGSGGVTPYTWSLAIGSPALPAGLTLDPITGTLTGTPTATGTTAPIFRLEDSSTPEQSVQKSLTITITTTPQPLTITTASLPEGAVNQPYPPTTVQATGGIQPYTWSVNPALPNGMQFNVHSPGTISGTPLTAGTTTHTFTVSDSDTPSKQTATQLSLTIHPTPTPLVITSPSGSSLPNGRVGKNYSTTLTGSGGILPYTWSITPALPTGLVLNTATGAITGKPASGTIGIYSLTITLRDSALPANQTKDKQVTLTVTP